MLAYVYAWRLLLRKELFADIAATKRVRPVILKYTYQNNKVLTLKYSGGDIHIHVENKVNSISYKK